MFNYVFFLSIFDVYEFILNSCLFCGIFWVWIMISLVYLFILNPGMPLRIFFVYMLFLYIINGVKIFRNLNRAKLIIQALSLIFAFNFEVSISVFYPHIILFWCSLTCNISSVCFDSGQFNSTIWLLKGS